MPVCQVRVVEMTGGVTGFRLGSGKDKRKERRDVYFEEFS